MSKREQKKCFISVRITPEIREQLKELNINVSATCREALIEEIKKFSKKKK